MANRKRVQKNSPRAHQTADPCISFKPDGSVEVFKPKRKPPRTKIERDASGKYIITSKERALY